MIRFGMPLFNADGKKRGIILLNYYAGLLIKNLEKINSNEFSQFSFLNSDGYWLKKSESGSGWGFMYKDRKKMTFGNKFSTEWQEILNSKSGQMLTLNGLFSFSTYYPLRAALKSSTGSGEAYGSSNAIIEGQEYFFKLVSHVPHTVLKNNSKKAFNKLLRLYLGLSVVFAIGAFIFTNFRENKRKIQEDRKKLIHELKKALNDVKILQGIIPICSYCKKIRDDEGMWNILEAYIHNHSEAKFSHGICPDCLKREMESLE